MHNNVRTKRSRFNSNVNWDFFALKFITKKRETPEIMIIIIVVATMWWYCIAKWGRVKCWYVAKSEHVINRVLVQCALHQQ